MDKQYVIRLSPTQRDRAARLAESTAVPVRVQLWAGILLAANEGQSDQQIASRLRTSVATVQRTRKRCVREGFDSAVRWRGKTAGAAGPAWGATVFGQARQIDGLIGVAVVDFEGACLAKEGGEGLDLDAAAAGNAAVVRAKTATIEKLDLGDSLEAVLITLTTQHHLIRVLPTERRLFVFAIIDRQFANLALARHQFDAMDWSEVG